LILSRESRWGKEIRLNFICTIQKEKSFYPWVWAQTSGNTLPCEEKGVFFAIQILETTELFPIAAKTLEQTGIHG
jgi:hypothetical protein